MKKKLKFKKKKDLKRKVLFSVVKPRGLHAI